MNSASFYHLLKIENSSTCDVWNLSATDKQHWQERKRNWLSQTQKKSHNSVIPLGINTPRVLATWQTFNHRRWMGKAGSAAAGQRFTCDCAEREPSAHFTFYSSWWLARRPIQMWACYRSALNWKLPKPRRLASLTRSYERQGFE